MVDERIPLNTFGISFALCGVAGVWSQAQGFLPFATEAAILFWLLASSSFILLIVLHTTRGAKTKQTLIDQLRHPEQSPMAALIPMILMLLSETVSHVWHNAGTLSFLASLALAALFAIWLSVQWFISGLDHHKIHGGHLLPLSGSTLVAALVAAKLGLTIISVTTLIIGLASWVLFGGLLLRKIFFKSPLEDSLVPTKSLIVAPPALASTTHLILEGNPRDWIFLTLLGLTVSAVALQLKFLTRFFAVKFVTSHWGFTFPAAASALLTLNLLAQLKPGGWQVYSLIPVAFVTGLVVTNAARDLARLGRV